MSTTLSSSFAFGVTRPTKVDVTFFEQWQIDKASESPGGVTGMSIASWCFLFSICFIIIHRRIKIAIRHQELKQKLKEAEETYAELDEENGGVMDRSKVEFWRNVSRNIKESDMIEEDKEEFDPVTRMEEIKADNVRLYQKQPRHVDLASREHVNRIRGGEGSKSGLFSSTRREPLSSSKTTSTTSNILEFQNEHHLHGSASHGSATPFPSIAMSRNHIHTKIASPPNSGNTPNTGKKKTVNFLASSKDEEDKNRQIYNNNLSYTASALAYTGGLRDSKNYSKMADIQNSIFTIKAKKQINEHKKNIQLQSDPTIHASKPAPVHMYTTASNNSFWSVGSFFGTSEKTDYQDQEQHQLQDDFTL